MSAPIVIAYAAPEHHRAICDAIDPEVAELWPRDSATAEAALSQGSRLLILLAVGANGGELAADLVSMGEQVQVAVRAIVLVGPVAPWAERVPCGRCLGCVRGGTIVVSCESPRLPLGPLEPLRAWGERALLGCSACVKRGWRSSNCTGCSGRGADFRLIITAHPEPVACVACNGRGWHIGECHPREQCGTCFGTGRALGPATILMELAGDGSPPEHIERVGETTTRSLGGLTIVEYDTRADHDREAIGAAMRRALEGLR